MMNEKEFERLYEEFWDGAENVPESVSNAYKAMHEAFENYLCAINEYMFRSALKFVSEHTAKAEIKKAV